MQCGNRCLKCPSKECPYVYMLPGGAKGFTKAMLRDPVVTQRARRALRVPSATTLRARTRIKIKYDRLVKAQEVYADMKAYDKCLDLRDKVPTP